MSSEIFKEQSSTIQKEVNINSTRKIKILNKAALSARKEEKKLILQKNLYFLISFLKSKCEKVHLSAYFYVKISEFIYHDKELVPEDLEVEFECDICSYTWKVKDDDNFFQNGTKCTLCNKLVYFKAKIEPLLNNKYKDVLEYKLSNNQYIARYENICLTCCKCGEEWQSSLIELLCNKQTCACYLSEIFKGGDPNMYPIYGFKWCVAWNGQDNLTSDSFVKIIHLQCLREQQTTLSKHLSGKSFCKYCHQTKGERTISNYLESKLGLRYCEGAVTPSYPFHRYDVTPRYFTGKVYEKLRADFLFRYNNINFMVEFDGKQHFEKSSFHETQVAFIRQRRNDFNKTKKAIDEGYCVIRIDYSNEANIEYHMEEGIKFLISSGKKCYFSDKEKYQYIIKELK